MKIGLDYSCAGHWTQACINVGLDVAWHLTRFPHADDILRANFEQIPLALDMSPDVPFAAPVDYVFGSPPCDAWNAYTYSRTEAHKEMMARHTIQWISTLLSRATRGGIMENVPRFAKSAELEQIRRMVGDRFEVAVRLISAAEFGGTQTRKRVYVFFGDLAERADELVPIPFTPPGPVLANVANPGYTRTMKSAMSVRQRPPWDASDGDWMRKKLIGDTPAPSITGRAGVDIFRLVGSASNASMTPVLEADGTISLEGRRYRGLGTREAAALMGFPATFRLDYEKEACYGDIAKGVDIRATSTVLRQLFSSHI